MLFKQRLIDNYSQEWNTEIEKSLVLQLYKTCKTTLSYENYLDMIPKNYRFFITRMRMSAHELRIQTGRYGQNRLPRNERYCLCCNNNDIEDEYHFILICPCFLDFRKKFIKKYFYKRPSMMKFIELICNNKKNVILNMAKYIKESLNLRKTIVNSIS